MLTKWRNLIGFGLLLWFGVLAQIQARASSLPEKPAKSGSRDIKVPKVLVKKIEKEYRDYLALLAVSAKDGIKRQPLNVFVELTQKRRAALQEEVRIVTPLGGGIIDFADFVTPVRGGFFTKIVGHLEGDVEPENLRAFYVSRAKKRDIQGEDYGAGCDKLMEVSRYFNKAMTDKGIEVYSADQRYLSVLGGTFVLFSFAKEALYVGSVTFQDSRYDDLMCDI